MYLLLPKWAFRKPNKLSETLFLESKTFFAHEKLILKGFFGYGMSNSKAFFAYGKTILKKKNSSRMTVPLEREVLG